MQQEIYETIIVGGGIAGIGCLRSLGSRDTLLLTQDVGGRISVSRDRCVNYGAYYVRKDYTHILSFVYLKRRIFPNDLLFETNKRLWRAHSLFIHHPVLMFRFLKKLKQFDKHYQQFKKASEHVSQKIALSHDPFLTDIFQKDAKTYLHEQNLTSCISLFLDSIIKSSAFIDVENHDVSAGFMFQLSLILLYPIYLPRIE